MVNTSDISRGLVLKLDGSLYTVVEFGENKTARAAAKVWAKLSAQVAPTAPAPTKVIFIKNSL